MFQTRSLRLVFCVISSSLYSTIIKVYFIRIGASPPCLSAVHLQTPNPKSFPWSYPRYQIPVHYHLFAFFIMLLIISFTYLCPGILFKTRSLFPSYVEVVSSQLYEGEADHSAKSLYVMNIICNITRSILRFSLTFVLLFEPPIQTLQLDVTIPYSFLLTSLVQMMDASPDLPPSSPS